MCVAYEGDDGTRYDHVPYHQSVLHKVRPVYETLPGWGIEIETGGPARGSPAAARDYVRFVEEFAGVHVSIVGVGPARDQTIVLPRAVACSAMSDARPRRRRRRARARARVGPRALAARRRGGLRAREPRHGDARRVRAGRRATDPARGRRPRRPSSTPTSWSSVPRTRWSRASSTRSRPRGRLAFGPSAAAARLEGSKAWMKDVLVAAGRADRPLRARSARRRGRGVRVPRDAARPLRREDRRARGGQGRGRHRVDRRGARRGARVPLGRRVRRRGPHLRDRRRPHRARALAVRAVRRPRRGAARAPRRTTSARSTATGPEHRRHGRVLAGAVRRAPTSSTR